MTAIDILAEYLAKAARQRSRLTEPPPRGG